MTTFNSSSEESVKWHEFKQFLVRDDGLRWHFLGVSKQIATPFPVNVPSAPGPDVIHIEDVEDKYYSESASARINAQRRGP